MKKKEVCFFVSDLNTTFVVDEVKNLSDRFEKVNVYVFDNSVSYTFKGNVIVKAFDFKTYRTSATLKRHIFTFLGIVLSELIVFPKYLLHMKQFQRAVSELLRSFHVMDQLQQVKIVEKNALYYTYWFNQWATVLVIAKKKKLISSFITRAHGTDLYEYRVPVTKHIPFRRFQLKNAAHVFSVSETGAKYLSQKYPVYKNKIHTSYLGSEDNGEGFFDPQGIFTIVSCAHVRNIKRIHMIPEILMHADFPVRWIHIGGMAKNDPTCDMLVKNIAEVETQNKLVSVEMKGNLLPEQVVDFYKITSVNLFLSVSVTEGLPVSMMEAISYGIPILATDVGGCKEIATNNTGRLIPSDFNTKQVADVIAEIKDSSLNTIQGRKEIREFWRSVFEVQGNFSAFLKTAMGS
ncbi:MAG: glycosyl transferase family 1 [Bacteroidetes bacterium]|jgi:glycosyltransferase involved in cell wall biosynthesis|nr:glycosyl transferase family 1 [Bacteroidota bacterium]